MSVCSSGMVEDQTTKLDPCVVGSGVGVAVPASHFPSCLFMWLCFVCHTVWLACGGGKDRKGVLGC